MRARRLPLLLASILIALSAANLFRLLHAQPSATPAPAPIVELRGAPPSPRDLPNDCAIVASEAASRLAATGAWTRVIFVEYGDPRLGRLCGHALVVWQPPATHTLCIYDASGTLDLETHARDDADAVGREWAKDEKVFFLAAHYLK